MKLNARVIETISGADYADKQPRIKLKVAEADSCFRTFIVLNVDGLVLDAELVVLLLTKEQAAACSNDLNSLRFGTVNGVASRIDRLIDQLRPDDLPPFMVTTEPQPPCSECKHVDPLDEKGRCTNTRIGSDNMDIDVCGHRCGTAQPDTADTQEFKREVDR